MAEQTIMVEDEADIILANERLTAEVASLKADLKASQELTATESARADIEKARAEKAESEIVTLRTAKEDAEAMAATAKQEAEAALKAKADTDAKMTDFNKSVAAEVARLGIRHEAVDKPAPKSDKRLSATEKLLALKGVANLSELEAKSKK